MKFHYLMSFFLFISCNSQPPKKYYKKENLIISEHPKPKVITNKKKSTFSKSNLISNQNVKEKLFDYGLKNKENRVIIKTEFGKITVRLYDETPLHRANFIMLAKKGFFDSTIFYRVIRNFMIQGGNSDKNNMLQKMAKIGMYKVPPEINKKYIHKRGALAMAVPEQYYKDPSKQNLSSSPYNFYIIQKGPISDSYIDKIEIKYQIDISAKNRTIYKSVGGSPHLDNEYTVFGEVVRGMNVVDKISKVITNGKNRPLENIYLQMEVLKNNK